MGKVAAGASPDACSQLFYTTCDVACRIDPYSSAPCLFPAISHTMHDHVKDPRYVLQKASMRCCNLGCVGSDEYLSCRSSGSKARSLPAGAFVRHLLQADNTLMGRPFTDEEVASVETNVRCIFPHIAEERTTWPRQCQSAYLLRLHMCCAQQSFTRASN